MVEDKDYVVGTRARAAILKYIRKLGRVYAKKGLSHFTPIEVRKLIPLYSIMRAQNIDTPV